MGDDISVTLRFTEDGLEVFDEAGNKIQSFGQQADEANSGGISSLSGGLMGLWSAMKAGQMAFGMIDNFISLGEETTRTDASLNILTNNQAPAWMDALREATHGTADNMTLAHDASLMLASGLVTNAQQAASLAREATDLGISMADLPTMMEQFAATGRANVFAQYGLNIQALKADYKTLVHEGVDPATAAMQAFRDVGDPLANKLDSTVRATSQWEQLKTTVSNDSQAFAEFAAGGVNKALTALGQLGQIWNSLAQHPTIALTAVVTTATSNYQATMNQDNQADAQAHDAFMNTLFPNRQSAATNQFLQPFAAQGSTTTTSAPQQTFLNPFSSTATGGQNAPSAATQWEQNPFQRPTTDAATKPAESMAAAEHTAEMMKEAGQHHRDAAAAMQTAAYIHQNAADGMQTAAKNFTSVSQAFGVDSKKGGLGAEVDKGFQQSIDAQQKSLDRMWGPNSQQAQQFAAAAKEEMNGLAVSFGQTTPEMLKFTGLQEQINAGVAKGSISVSAAAADFKAMAAAVKDGNTSMQDMIALQSQVSSINKVSGQLDKTGFGDQLKNILGDQVTGATAGSAKPFADTLTGLDNLKTGADNATQTIGKIGPAGQQAGLGVAAGMSVATLSTWAAVAAGTAYYGVLQQIKAIGG